MKRDFAEVASGDTGEITPRHLNLNRAREKGFTLKEGQKIEIALNPQNLVVDYHPVGHAKFHQIIHGQLKHPLVVGQTWAIIRKKDGAVHPYPVRPLARSIVAAIPIGTDAIFFIDESDKIADAIIEEGALANRTDDEWAASPAKNVYSQTEGKIASIFPPDKLTIAMPNQGELQFSIWSFAQSTLEKTSLGDKIILLLDSEDKVVNIAKPAPNRPLE